jgi:hypothetical protein
VHQQRKKNKREYLALVREITKIQRMARQYILKRRWDRAKEVQGLQEAKKRENDNYRVTRAMQIHLRKHREGAGASNQPCGNNVGRRGVSKVPGQTAHRDARDKGLNMVYWLG